MNDYKNNTRQILKDRILDGQSSLINSLTIIKAN